MRTVTVEVPEGHMVKIVKEESMQPTQKVTGGGKFEFEGETFIPGDVIINPNRGGGSMMILSEIREERRRRTPHSAHVPPAPSLPETGFLRNQDRHPFLDRVAAAGGHYPGNA